MFSVIVSFKMIVEDCGSFHTSVFVKFMIDLLCNLKISSSTLKLDFKHN